MSSNLSDNYTLTMNVLYATSMAQLATIEYTGYAFIFVCSSIGIVVPESYTHCFSFI